jgi:hypothetical protein
MSEAADESAIAARRDGPVAPHDAGAADRRMRRALTDFHTYALVLDARRERTRMGHHAIDDEIAALRSLIGALSAHADPSGVLL